MKRKMLATCVSLVAFAAFAVLPALASANKNVELLNGAGTLTLPSVEVSGAGKGAILKGKTAKLVFKGENNGPKFECEGEMTGELLKNNTINGSQATIKTASFWKIGGKAGEHCATSIFGATVGNTVERLPWCLASITNTDQVTLDAGDCAGHQNLRFTLHLTIFGAASGTCIYEAEHAVANANLNVTPAVVTAIPTTATFTRVGACTTETAKNNLPEKGEMEGAFTITREDVAENVQFST
jgi:hypothetical protein